jgi:hypothetical protein
MADIDQIIAGGAGASSRADFSGIPKLLDSYWAGKDQAAKNDLREAFKGGVPTLPDGSLDISSVMKTLFQKGDIAGGVGLAGTAANAQERSMYAGGGAPPVNYGPPATGRNAVAPDPSVRAPVSAAPAGIAAPSAPQDQPTIMKILAAQGIPNDQLGAASASVARQMGIDPTAPLDLKDPQVRNVLAPAVAQIKKMGLGQVQPPQPGDNQPQQIPQPQVAQAPQQAPQGFQPSPQQIAAQNDPKLKRLQFFAASPDKATAEAARAELKAYIESQAPTNSMKEAAAMGIPLKESLDRADENTTQRDILTKSIIPRIDKSQETATAARDDIDAIHRARGELDTKGGVFSGAFADKKLYLAKAAELLGIANADKIQNTEAYGAAIGSRVASMVKAFGSGTAISDGDRRFAAAMAGGQVTLDENSMRRILDIGEQAARGKIDYHNQFVKKAVDANEGLKPARDSFVVNAPGQYKKPEQQAAGAQAQTMISSKADYDKLPKGAKFTGPDGKPWQKP